MDALAKLEKALSGELKSVTEKKSADLQARRKAEEEDRASKEADQKTEQRKSSSKKCRINSSKIPSDQLGNGGSMLKRRPDGRGKKKHWKSKRCKPKNERGPSRNGKIIGISQKGGR